MPPSQAAEVRKQCRPASSPRPVYRGIRSPTTDINNWDNTADISGCQSEKRDRKSGIGKNARRPMPRCRFYLDALQVRRAGRHGETPDISAYRRLFSSTDYRLLPVATVLFTLRSHFPGRIQGTANRLLAGMSGHFLALGKSATQIYCEVTLTAIGVPVARKPAGTAIRSSVLPAAIPCTRTSPLDCGPLKTRCAGLKETIPG